MINFYDYITYYIKYNNIYRTFLSLVMHLTVIAR